MIEIKNLRKTYGKKVALKSFSYTFEDGIYLDGGIKCAREFILTNMEKIINDSIKGKIFRDYKTCLQEVLQSNG